MTARALSVPPVWLLALAGAIVVGVVAGEAFLTWLPVVAAVCVLVTFGLQLALKIKEGLVLRILASIGGVLAILLVATIVLSLLHPDALGRLIS